MLVNKKGDMTPFDMKQKPAKQYPILLPLMWAGSYIMTRQFHLKIQKENMKNLKPPYLVIGTHQGFTDYYLGPLCMFPHRAMYVSDMEGFAAFGKWLYRGLGCIGKRRYVADTTVIKNMKYAIAEGQSVMVFPESRHSNVGTTAYIPKNMGRLVKMMDVPLVVMTAKGSYLANPFWDEDHTRKVPVQTTLTGVYTREQVRELPAEEIQKTIEAYLQYDEYRYQQENQILIKDKKRAEGLHKSLYQCRSCEGKYGMVSAGAELRCTSCGASWELTEDGWLASMEEARVHIPDWYEWERECAEQEVRDAIVNSNLDPATIKAFEVHVEALPNEKGFVDFGEGKLEFNEDEFCLQIKGEVLHFPHWIRESVQTEYNYRGKGMCIVLSTKDCCYYVYSQDKKFNPTELQFMGEYLYQQQGTSRR